MKLILIEDESRIVKALKKAIKEKNLATEEPVAAEFAEAEEKIKAVRPDVVILDIFEGNPEEHEDEGSKSLDFIWKAHFRPVIVYSAMPENVRDNYPDHPFIHYVKKGRGSTKKVMEKLERIKPYVDSLKKVEEYVDDTFRSVMKKVAPYAFKVYGEDDPQVVAATIRQAARRRLAAQMDELSSDDEKLAPWEQYIFPPISEEIRLGDILRKKNTSDGLDPSAFRLVLTPSCDLETGGGARNRKVEKVLVSQCCSVWKGLKQALNIEKKTAKNKEKIEHLLNAGHSNGIIPLPELKDLVPPMAANLRKLDLVSTDDIENSDSSEEVKYERIASLDSPFREMVSWAYMQIAGRPGLPERDIETWINEIPDGFDSVKKENE